MSQRGTYLGRDGIGVCGAKTTSSRRNTRTWGILQKPVGRDHPPANRKGRFSTSRGRTRAPSNRWEPYASRQRDSEVLPWCPRWVAIEHRVRQEWIYFFPRIAITWNTLAIRETWSWTHLISVSMAFEKRWHGLVRASSNAALSNSSLFIPFTFNSTRSDGPIVASLSLNYRSALYLQYKQSRTERRVNCCAHVSSYPARMCLPFPALG